MPAQRLKALLELKQIKYRTRFHAEAVTAQEIAATAHVPGKAFAKTVMVKLDGRLAMVVMPASRRVNFELLGRAADAGDVQLASESEFRNRFPDCEVGAMPPFGNLYELPVYVSDIVASDKEIAFNAGTLTELIQLSYRDYARLVKPKVAKLSL